MPSAGSPGGAGPYVIPASSVRALMLPSRPYEGDAGEVCANGRAPEVDEGGVAVEP